MSNEDKAVELQDEMATRVASSQMNAIRFCLGVAAAFAAVFSIINLNHELPLLGWTDLAMASSLTCFLWWSYHGASLKWIENIAIAHAAAFFLFLFFEGGVFGIGYVWMLGFPFIACFMVGSRTGLWYSLAFVLIVAVNGVLVREWQIDVYWDWQIIPYLAAVYAFFSVIAYLVVLSREKGEELASAVELQLRDEHRALAESESRYKTLLNTSPNAIGVHRDGKWVYVNPAAVKLFAAASLEEIVGTNVMDYVHPDHHAMVIERMKAQREKNAAVPVVEEKLVRRNGEVFLAEVQSSPVSFEGQLSFLTACLDISQRKKHEEEKFSLLRQLEHAQRLESLGVLAGGIAHDFNNLLAAILGNVELARMEVDESPKVKEHFDNLEEICDQAAKLSRQMLFYAGKGNYELSVLNINNTVRSMAKLIRASVGGNVEMLLKLDSTVPNVEGDPSQIQQLILNFIVNAAEAIGSDSGTIKLTTKVEHAKRHLLDELYNGTNLSEGDYVVIEVNDSGCGMDEELMGKIFDPFFTTKEAGTGLGLSAVLGIITAHRGAVQVISKPERGTTFRILIPSTDKPAATRAVRTFEMEEWQGEGTILVVDDDPAIRSIVTSLVKKLNFDSITANDGQEGINQFRKHHKRLVAVMLDMTMPQVGGMDAMMEMRRIDSSIPIILVSGYSENESSRLVSGEQPDAFLQKPFRAKEMKKCLYQVLQTDGL